MEGIEKVVFLNKKKTIVVGGGVIHSTEKEKKQKETKGEFPCPSCGVPESISPNMLCDGCKNPEARRMTPK